jgi:FKBP-type peptidyl-prolyl cis-trans isomerase FkpA
MPSVLGCVLALLAAAVPAAGQQPTQQELVDRLLGSAPAQAEPGEDPEQVARILYALGFGLWRPVLQLGLSGEEAENVLRGLRDAAAGGEPTVELETYGPMIEAFARGRIVGLIEAEKVRAAAFVERAADEPGATRTASGLVFFDRQPGTGAMPSVADTVRVNYRGTLGDGTEFDSSYARGEPAEFQLSSVIPCWTEGVAMMRVGGTARLVCPASLGYGDRGQPPEIPGGAALVFEVELLAVVGGALP